MVEVMAKPRIGVRSKREIGKALSGTLNAQRKEGEQVRELCGRILAISMEDEVEPEVMLHEIYRLVDIGENALRRKHAVLMTEGIEGGLSESERKVIEKDFARVTKVIKGRIERGIGAIPIAKVNDGGKESGKSNEDMTYVPSPERLSYIW